MSPTTALPRFQMLTPDSCELIHRASLEILRRTGSRVYHPEALELLAGSGSAHVRFCPA